MDEAWVCCEQNKCAAINSHVKTPIKVVPMPADITKYEKPYKPLDIPELKDKFVFYFIGEAIPRKNLQALLKAFHIEFAPHEQVALCIKTSLPGMNPVDCGKMVQNLSMDVKKNLKLYPDPESYHKEVVITSHMSEKDIMRLHATCDCFVMPSHGEAWSIPAFDAMAMGNTPLVTMGLGCDDFIGLAGFRVKASSSPVFGMTSTFDNLCCGNESWWDISVENLQECMRYVFEKDLSATRQVGNDRAQEFSYKAVGEKMKGLLSCP
jgi:glycosyltransferase involved in cell wall biosynthesis